MDTRDDDVLLMIALDIVSTMERAVAIIRQFIASNEIIFEVFFLFNCKKKLIIKLKNQSCTENFNGTRCSNQIRRLEPSSTLSPQRKSSQVPHVVYGLSVVVIICLCLVGVYLLIQKGFFDGLNMNTWNRIRGFVGRDLHFSNSGPTSTRSNMFFNKLEDEQSIVNTET